MGQRYEVMTSREFTTKDGQTKRHYTTIGSAFQNQDGSFGIQLDAVPLDGKLYMRVAMSKAEREAKFGSHGQAQRQASGFGGGGNRKRYGSRGQSQPQPLKPDPTEEWAGGDDDQLAFPGDQ